jgi:carboxy-cis,cis-muconate cyclase
MLTPPTPAHPSPYALFTTTRGSTPATRGWLSILAIDEDGYFADGGSPDGSGYHVESVIRYETQSSGGKANAIDLLTKRKVPSVPQRVLIVGDDDLDEGEANVGDFDEDNLETRPHKQVPLQAPLNQTESASAGDEEGLWQEEDQGVWILLTDDDETTAANANKYHAIGGVKVLEWGGWGKQGVHLVAQWPEPVDNDDHGDDEYHDSIKTKLHERMVGGSHAIWLV